jgi:hypothetical protein
MRPCQPGNVFQHVDPQFREFVAAVAAADIAAAKNQLTAAIQNRVADGPAKARQGSRETNRTIPPHFWIRKANGGSIPSSACEDRSTSRGGFSLPCKATRAASDQVLKSPGWPAEPSASTSRATSSSRQATAISTWITKTEAFSTRRRSPVFSTASA